MRLLMIGTTSNSLLKTKLVLDSHYLVDHVINYQLGLELATNNFFQLIVVALLNNNFSGLRLIRKIRLHGIQTPILAIGEINSNHRVSQILNCGGDDSLVMPFNKKELLARINALIRRGCLKEEAHFSGKGHFMFDPDTHYLLFHKKPIFLPRKQRFIFECLLIHHPQVVTRNILTTHVWQKEWIKRSNIDVQISQLRRNLEKQAGFDPIETVHCFGYRLALQE